MHKYILEREDALLLIVDIQDKLARVMKYKEQALKNNLTMLAAAKEMGFPALATAQYPKGLGPVLPELSGQIAPENLFDKDSFTAYTTNVAARLKDLGRKKIILSGMETHICVFLTARDLLLNGYEVFVLRDAVTSRTRENYLNGLDLMQGAGAVITNTETALYDLMQVSGTPEFKQLSQLIK